MEDYLIREIDKIGEMLMHVARRLGLIADALAWLDSKGYYSFRLHSLEKV